MSGYATSTKAKIGLLRYGELFSGQFNKGSLNSDYWLITPNESLMNIINKTTEINISGGGSSLTTNNGIKPALNLKENVIITSGDGTKNNPFTVELKT